MTVSERHRLVLPHDAGLSALEIGGGVLTEPSPELRSLFSDRRVFVIASAPVDELHPGALDALLERSTVCERLVIADGEAAKTVAVAEDLWRRLLEGGGKRDSLLVAFGGGSIGDLTGFVAATFLRGVEWVQVPTTLLGQVDAAIGGKTGINLRQAKNVVGAFHHPEAVVSDTRLLATLPSPELRSGLVEVIKMAALLDLDLLTRVEGDLERLLAAEAAALTPVVAAAAAAKVEVVTEDPFEQGRRKLLNFGHTLGHALEAAAGYGELRHGEAVGWGILFALRLAVRRDLPAADAERLVALLDRLPLPPLPELDSRELLRRLDYDKKGREGGLRWVLPRRLGEGDPEVEVPDGELVDELERFLGR